ncbi:two-component system sensor histidine kinase DcuS [Salipaludibacillus agaradhaerens]|uniref:histidine kinase n=1 Tax=Salipaludibacillus agaradhaerens TaxID=76935 RepID=A0A9Q4AYV2_SALAG|nr:DcuS/MalK family sensor histidine kinase [Salipaludibacillus agaradhaerens]MCR6095184.1 two-component system sensor histidine kinase DcuS [Salipaludibacillus agaradhaerens]MCR6115258.1 two-component system sensor histidine kinase DcuS [Salipaludibacillus agaradhaerens]
MKTQRFKLRTIIIFLVITVVIISLLVTDLLVSRTINDNIMSEQEEQGLTVARIAARADAVVRGLIEDDPSIVQAYTTEIQEASEVMFVVVMDMDGIRYSHPDPELIGKPFQGDDETKALAGQEYSSISQGTLSASLRSFTPVYNEVDQQIGAVAVGISLENVESTLQKSHRNIILGSLVGIFVGIIGAYVIANYIRKILYGLEPSTIAKTFEERNTMLQSVHEGIIAVDRNAKITLINESGQSLFKKAGLEPNPVGMDVQAYLPATGLKRVLETGRAELDAELHINGATFLVNRVPLMVDQTIIGAISTFRDKTELNALAEQLTGVKLYSEALRAQSHEMMNKWHVILGLMRTESYEELKEYILQVVNLRYERTEKLTKNIKDPVLVGFLIGKLSYAKEKNVQLSIECLTEIPSPITEETNHHLITIIGNLIDNAIEALEDKTEKNIVVSLFYENRWLKINVTDSGTGIKQSQFRFLFNKGYSTKGSDRGYGLHLVKSVVDHLEGTIAIESFAGNGTEFIISIPYETEVDETL